MKQIPLIIDTDPGIDDAVAIALAVFNPRFDVQTGEVRNRGLER